MCFIADQQLLLMVLCEKFFSRTSPGARSDCTNPNVRKAQSLSRIYDDLEARIARLMEQEQLDAVRPVTVPLTR